MNEKILVVEDDSDINALLRRILISAGYAVDQAYSGTEGWLYLRQETPALILLDLMLPGLTGEEFLTKLRAEAHKNCPVIVISAKSALSDKVGLLDLGADDYITKPFAPEEVIARVRAALRRVGAAAPEDTAERRYKNLVLNPDSRSVSVCGESLSLTVKEYDILALLLANPEKVYSREKLYEIIWQDNYYGADHTINVHVSNLRKKIKAADPDAEYIASVYGIGFRLAPD